MKRILVTGAGGPAATNFIRSLRLAEEPIHIAGTDANPFHLALSHADANYELPLVSDPTYLPELNRVIEREEIEFVHAQPDVEVQFLSQHRNEVKAGLLLPSQATIDICADKLALAECLGRAGVPAAETYPVRDEESLTGAVQALLHEHGKVWLRARRGAGGRASLPVTTPDQALMWVSYWSANNLRVDDFMVSAFLPGREFAFQSLWDHGRLVTSQSRERLEYLFGYLTPSGQTSSPALAKTVHRSDVNEAAAAAVRAVDEGAHGIFCVDLKEDARGVPCVTEINAGRFFTTSIFFSAAGCNMPYYYLRMAYDEELPDLPQFNAIREGLYWVRLMDMGDKLLDEGAWTDGHP